MCGAGSGPGCVAIQQHNNQNIPAFSRRIRPVMCQAMCNRHASHTEVPQILTALTVPTECGVRHSTRTARCSYALVRVRDVAHLSLTHDAACGTRVADDHHRWLRTLPCSLMAFHSVQTTTTGEGIQHTRSASHSNGLAGNPLSQQRLVHKASSSWKGYLRVRSARYTGVHIMMCLG